MNLRNFVLTAVGAALIMGTNNIVLADHHDPHAGSVMNYHRIDARLVTGGHFTGDGLAAIKAEGVTVVIDLRDEPPGGQEKRLAEQGIEWINIPVDWDDPKAGDFEKFSAAMETHKGDHVLVQCSANYRASAMTYLYRVVGQQVGEEEAAKDLHVVWTPSEESARWHQYMEGVKAAAR